MQQIGRSEVAIRERRDGLIRLDLGSGIGREWVQRIVFVEVELRSGAVDEATGGKEKTRDAGLLGEVRNLHRCIAIDGVWRRSIRP